MKRFTIKIKFLTAFICLVFSMQSQSQSSGNKKNVATYQANEEGSFMRSWYIAGPLKLAIDSSSATDSLQRLSFQNDSLPPGVIDVSRKTAFWKLYTSSGDQILLDSLYPSTDYAYAYALAEINSSADQKIIMGLGSDDAIKVWLNGNLVHEKFVGRGIEIDNDIVPLHLMKGKNQLLLKIQDMEDGWGFVARIMDEKSLADKLYVATVSGDMKMVKQLLESDIIPENKGKNGLSPVVAAKLSGRNDIFELLKQYGAADVDVPAGSTIVDAYYDAYFKEGPKPALAILVAKSGQILYNKAFGFADLNNKISATPETKFRVGSVTKQFTAASILKLQEQGKLSVHDALSKFLPGFPRGDEVTIDELLTHTSGIHSYTSHPDFIRRVTQTISADTLIALIQKDPYDFNPGERYLYNNSAYFILGYIIGKVSGMPYGEFLQKYFFQPLGMANTGVHYAGIKLPNEAKGYVRKGTAYDTSINWDMSWAGGAGALYSTVADLLKWNRALYGGAILHDSSLQAALTPAKLKNGETISPFYGYGLGMGKYRGLGYIQHSGGLHGFLTQLSFYPNDSLTVVMFTNTSDPQINLDPNKIAEAFLWKKMEKQENFQESSDTLANLYDYEGRYNLAGRLVINVTVEDNNLFAQLSGQAKYQVFPLAKDEFFWKVVPAKIKFARDSNGMVISGTLFQNGQEILANKLPDFKIIKADPATFDQYLGTYRMDADNADVVISREGNSLFAHPTGQPKYKLEAIGPDEFAIPSENAVLTFIKGGDGKIEKISLDANGVKMDLPKTK